MFDTIIIGCGPSGMTAALYLLRANKSVLLLEKEGIGGQIAESPRLENYPSIPSISGSEFADKLFSQIQDLGAEFEFAEALEIQKEGNTYIVKTDGDVYSARSVILANGCKHRKLGLEREEELTGHGISYCATCDGAFFRDQNVVVIGDANSALQYAIALSEICKHVQIMTLFDRYFADPILVKRVQENPKISAEHEWSAIRFEGNKDLTGVTFQNTKTKETQTIPCQGCFIAIGQIPHNDAYASFVDLNRGFIVTDENMATKTPGLFACGDTRVKKVRQVATAIGDGANAAMNCLAYLSSLVAA
ncbi:MAG: FAD-dependent oxidoreductase [Mollicutes bacterium]|nr:FAD-dependent oxidoreductase [Mollicutes bacterium]MDD7064113.1 FAD-dependent oxidoreductase [Mollicutes bacterium]